MNTRSSDGQMNHSQIQKNIKNTLSNLESLLSQMVQSKSENVTNYKSSLEKINSNIKIDYELMKNIYLQENEITSNYNQTSKEESNINSTISNQFNFNASKHKDQIAEIEKAIHLKQSSNQTKQYNFQEIIDANFSIYIEKLKTEASSRKKAILEYLENSSFMNVIEIQSILYDYNQLFQIYVLDPLLSWQNICTKIMIKTQEYTNTLDNKIRLKFFSQISINTEKMNKYEKKIQEKDKKCKIKLSQIDSEIDSDNKQLDEYIDSVLKVKREQLQNIIDNKLGMTSKEIFRNVCQKRFVKEIENFEVLFKNISSKYVQKIKNDIEETGKNKKEHILLTYQEEIKNIKNISNISNIKAGKQDKLDKLNKLDKVDKPDKIGILDKPGKQEKIDKEKKEEKEQKEEKSGNEELPLILIQDNYDLFKTLLIEDGKLTEEESLLIKNIKNIKNIGNLAYNKSLENLVNELTLNLDQLSKKQIEEEELLFKHFEKGESDLLNSAENEVKEIIKKFYESNSELIKEKDCLIKQKSDCQISPLKLNKDIEIKKSIEMKILLIEEFISKKIRTAISIHKEKVDIQLSKLRFSKFLNLIKLRNKHWSKRHYLEFSNYKGKMSSLQEYYNNINKQLLNLSLDLGLGINSGLEMGMNVKLNSGLQGSRSLQSLHSLQSLRKERILNQRFFIIIGKEMIARDNREMLDYFIVHLYEIGHKLLQEFLEKVFIDIHFKALIECKLNQRLSINSSNEAVFQGPTTNFNFQNRTNFTSQNSINTINTINNINPMKFINYRNYIKNACSRSLKKLQEHVEEENKINELSFVLQTMKSAINIFETILKEQKINFLEVNQNQREEKLSFFFNADFNRNMNFNLNPNSSYRKQNEKSEIFSILFGDSQDYEYAVKRQIEVIEEELYLQINHLSEKNKHINEVIDDYSSKLSQIQINGKALNSILNLNNSNNSNNPNNSNNSNSNSNTNSNINSVSQVPNHKFDDLNDTNNIIIKTQCINSNEANVKKEIQNNSSESINFNFNNLNNSNNINNSNNFNNFNITAKTKEETLATVNFSKDTDLQIEEKLPYIKAKQENEGKSRKSKHKRKSKNSFFDKIKINKKNTINYKNNKNNKNSNNFIENKNLCQLSFKNRGEANFLRKIFLKSLSIAEVQKVLLNQNLVKKLKIILFGASYYDTIKSLTNDMNKRNTNNLFIFEKQKNMPKDNLSIDSNSSNESYINSYSFLTHESPEGNSNDSFNSDFSNHPRTLLSKKMNFNFNLQRKTKK